MASLFVPLPLTCSRILSLETQSLADQSPCSLSSTPSSGMEHLWSRAVATGGNRWQMERPRKWLRQANSVAVGCDRLPRERHGKEGVDGSSPSEGSAKAPHIEAFSFRPTCSSSNVRTESESSRASARLGVLLRASRRGRSVRAAAAARPSRPEGPAPRAARPGLSARARGGRGRRGRSPKRCGPPR
jgi:hypothetical protein